MLPSPQGPTLNSLLPSVTLKSQCTPGELVKEIQITGPPWRVYDSVDPKGSENTHFKTSSQIDADATGDHIFRNFQVTLMFPTLACFLRITWECLRREKAQFHTPFPCGFPFSKILWISQTLQVFIDRHVGALSCQKQNLATDRFCKIMVLRIMVDTGEERD